MDQTGLIGATMPAVLIRIILLTLITAAPAFAQYYPCLVDVNPPITGRTTYRQRRELNGRQPDYRPRAEPDSAYYTIGGGGYSTFFVSMPVKGQCSGSFVAALNQTDLDRASREIIGRTTGFYTNNAPTVELIITDLLNFTLFQQGRNYVAVYRSGQTPHDTFAPTLPAGQYVFILSNAASTFAPKTVRLTFGPIDGEHPRNPQTPAPNNAPITPKTPPQSQPSSNTHRTPKPQ